MLSGSKVVASRPYRRKYLLVRRDIDDDTWYCMCNTPGVNEFVGQSQKCQKPTPLSRWGGETFLSTKGDGQDAPKRKSPKLDDEVGEGVRVKEGPFTDLWASSQILMLTT